MKTHLHLIVGLTLFLCGCTRGYKIPIGDQTYAAVPEQAVAILLVPPKNESSFKIIGLVKAKGAHFAADDAVYSKLRKAAADLGADAVIVNKEYAETRFVQPATVTAVGNSSTSGNIDYYNGNYNENTTSVAGATYTPAQDIKGLTVTGVAIKYIK